MEFNFEVSQKFEVLGRMYILVEKQIRYNIYLRSTITSYTVFSDITETVFRGTKEEGQLWLNNLHETLPTIQANTTEPNNCPNCGSVAPLHYNNEYEESWFCRECYSSFKIVERLTKKE